jgi:inner membrane protease subunit 1
LGGRRGGLPRWLQLVGSALLLRDYVAEVARCTGESMEPTLRDRGDVVLVEKWTPGWRQLCRGDVVIAASPWDPSKLLCKRVVGLPGDLVSLQPTPSLHGLGITLPFVLDDDPDDFRLERAGHGGTLTIVPRGHVWLQGDNVGKSVDSRTFGPVPVGLVRGRVLCKLWPLRHLGCPLAPPPPAPSPPSPPPLHALLSISVGDGATQSFSKTINIP